MLVKVTRRHVAATTLAAIVACITGCAGPERLVVVAELSVTVTGEYLLQGKAVLAENLASRLKELRVSTQSLELTIRADPRAKSEAVNNAVRAVREAGIARLAFTSSETTK